MQLKDTIEGMTSADYKDRFWAEYQQLKIRYEKLRKFNARIRAAQFGGQEPKHDCPLELLEEQERFMVAYLKVLEIRASIEGIDL